MVLVYVSALPYPKYNIEALDARGAAASIINTIEKIVVNEDCFNA